MEKKLTEIHSPSLDLNRSEEHIDREGGMDFSGHEGEIPIPITSTFLLGGGAHCQSQSNVIGPPAPPETLTPRTLPTPDNSKKGAVVKYRECLKNHAASIGGNATDGCGEFMPSGKEGTLESFKCSACHCHRNFHRKEAEGISSYSCDCFQNNGGRKMMEGYITGARPFPHQMIMPLGAIQTSESDEMEDYMTRTPIVKKRFRTKFSVEQKEKMLEFAEKVGWKLQKQEESLVQQFCQEIGVKRRVLKVWMHNNKHSLAKKSRNLQLDWSTSTTTVTDL